MSAENWPSWKLVAVIAPGYGVFGAIVAFVPTYSLLALVVGASMTLGSIVATVIASKSKSWFAQATLVGLLGAMIVLIGARHWAALLPHPWIWYLLHVILYLSMWTLPALAPQVSAFLEREQRIPETNLGLGCLRTFMIIGPAAGILGASLAMYGPRFGLENWVTLFMAVGGTSVGLGFQQYFAHHLWQERPWASEPNAARQVEAQ